MTDLLLLKCDDIVKVLIMTGENVYVGACCLLMPLLQDMKTCMCILIWKGDVLGGHDKYCGEQAPGDIS